MKPREKPCHWDPAKGWLTPEHERRCDDRECDGCKPCPKSHCAMRGRCPSHVQAAAGIITCPGCIGKVRRDLFAIETYIALLPAAAVEAAVSAGSLDVEAVVLAGPAPDPEPRAAAREYVEWQRGWCVWPPTTDMHPYAVLGRWDLALREVYGPATQLRVTVKRSVTYLRALLDQGGVPGGFPHGDEFEEFAKDISACRAHLEDVLARTRWPEVGRPCPRCVEERGTGPRLRKRHAKHVGAKDGEVCPERIGVTLEAEARRGWCSLPRVFLTAECSVCRGDHDTWHCSDVPEHWWTEADYRARVEVDYRQHASLLSARDLAARVKVPLSRVRKWCARTWDPEAEEWREPLLVSRHRSADGRKLYRVADAERLAEAERPDLRESV